MCGVSGSISEGHAKRSRWIGAVQDRAHARLHHPDPGGVGEDVEALVADGLQHDLAGLARRHALGDALLLGVDGLLPFGHILG